jgi:hypothetical protein
MDQTYHTTILLASDLSWGPGVWPENFMYQDRTVVRTQCRQWSAEGDLEWVLYQDAEGNDFKVFND